MRSQPPHAQIQDIHLISHGAPGCLFLGNTTLNLDNLETYRQALADWGGRWTSSASSLLLYGCQVAAGERGAALLDKLYQITGAAVFASTTPIGSPAQGGNWQLDAATPAEGSVSSLAFTDAALAAYDHTLPGPIAPDSSGASTSNAIPLKFGTPTVVNTSGTIGAAGTVATYQGVGNTLQGKAIDMTIKIVSTSDSSWPGGSTNAPKFGNTNNDARFQFSAAAFAESETSSRLNKTTQLRFEFWEAGKIGITPISISFGFNIKDLDKQDSQKSGAISVQRSQVSGYGVNNPTKLISPSNNGSTDLLFLSTANNIGSINEADPQFALQLSFESKSSVDITLTTEFDNSGFVFDGDRQFQFSNLITVGGDQYTTPFNTVLTVPVASGILSNDTDPDNGPQPLSVTKINGQAAAIGQSITLPSGAGLTVQSNGSFSYDPRGRGGFDSFIYTVSDGLESDDATVDITVTGTNSAPILDLNGSTATGVDYSKSLQKGDIVTLSSPDATLRDLDAPDIKILTITVAGLQNGADEKLTLGNVTRSLNANFVGTTTVSGIASTINVVLSNGGTTVMLSKTNGTNFTQAEANLLVRDLRYLNDAAVPSLGDRVFSFIAKDSANNTSNPATSTLSVQLPLTDDRGSTTEGVGITSNVQSNDFAKGAVTVSAPAANGTVIVSGTDITYTPKPFFSGVDTVTYQVGAATAKLIVQVAPLADTPTAIATDATGIQNQPLPLNLSGSALLDTDGSETRSFEITDVPSGSSFTNSSGTPIGSNLGVGVWQFTPAQLAGLQLVPPPGLTGSVTLNLRAIGTDKADLNGDGDTTDTLETNTKFSLPAPFQIRFEKLVDDSLLINENALVQSVDVKANDTLAGPITLATTPAQGSVSIDNNKILYTPNPNFSGTDELTYTVGSQTAKLSIVVRPVVETPVAIAANPDLIGTQNQAIALGLSGSTPQDNDGSESFRFEITNVPAGAAFTNSSGSVGTNAGNGRWSFTAAQLIGLSLVPPASLAGPIMLTLQGISTDTADLDKDGDTTDLDEQVTALSTPVNVQVTFRADANGNGTPDVEEPPVVEPPLPLDTDGDRIPNADDLDDDNDGIPDADEWQGNPNRDTDGDGIVDSLDLDADNDGMTDLGESGLSPAEIKALDGDGDGRIDLTNAFGSNGLANGVETTPNSGQADYNNDGIADPPSDSDGDGMADFQDLDSDNDGLSDVIEAGGTDLNGDGLIDGDATDTDGDGLADAVDPTSGRPRSGTPLPVPDTDGDGIADFRDLDSDNDGLFDLLEGGLNPAIVDLNGDGRVDGPDGDRDGIPDPIDSKPNQFGNSNSPTNTSIPDSNGDGVPDYRTPKPPTPPASPIPTPPPALPTPPAVLEGLSDQDILQGSNGNDRLNGGSEPDKIWGHEGDDMLNGGGGDDAIEGGNGKDFLSGGSGHDILRGDEGDDLLNGGSGDDWLDGGQGQDLLIGGSNQDQLYGHEGADTLQGGLGDDRLVGGGGRDLLSGGQGYDLFCYEATSDFGDTVLDFEIRFDRIDLRALGLGGSFGHNIRAVQMGAHTVLQVDTLEGTQQVATLLHVNAFTINSSHVLF
ncbi:MAG: DUF4347 domain-containing protein [Synechococcales cyanobacterium CRU_2_2]|nr:DUF4347 domain-containing protein [Synechococcales cyanobacterium CRU_2_2]